MSNEIQFPSASGLNVYAVLRNPSGSVWNTASSSFVTWADADIANYAMSMSEQGTSGYYTSNFPSGATTPDEYPVAVYRQLGASPALGDVLLGTGAVDLATEFNPTELFQIIHGCTGTVWIVDPVNGSDSTGNGSWTSPFKTPLPTASGGAHPASAGDTVLICGQSCDLGSVPYVMVAGVTLAGMGMMATTITSSAGGSGGADCVAPASNCTIRDLTVQSTLTPASNAYAYPIGNGYSAPTGVLLENVRTIGDTDGLYFNLGGSTVTARHCELISNWDCCLAEGAGTVVVIEDSHLFTTAQNSASPNSNGTVRADTAVVRLIRSPVINVAGNVNSSRFTNVVSVTNNSGSGGRVELINSPVFMSVDGSTQHNLSAVTGTSIIVENSAYDSTKTSGTIVVLS